MKKIIVSIIVVGLLSSISFLGIENTNAAIVNQSKNKDSVEYWAILVASNRGNAKYYVDDAFYFENVLITSGWKENNIRLLLNENATPSNVLDAIDWVAENDNPSDTMLIYFNCHSPLTFDGIRLYDYLKLKYSDLDIHLDNLSSSAIGIILDYQDSDSAIPYLQQEGRIIVTSNNDSGLYTAWNSGLFISGLVGIADKKPDIGDNNGMVSIEEVFNNILDECNSSNNNPQMQDNYTGQLNLLNMNLNYDQIDQFPNYHIDPNAIAPVSGYIYYPSQVAQSFEPSMNVLTKVKLYITFSDANCPLTVSIRNNLTGQDLTSVTVNSSNFPASFNNPKNHGYFIFDFPDINVIPGNTYYIYCSVPSNEQHIFILWGKEDDCYNKGKCYQSNDFGETWHDPELGLSDLFFVTYGFAPPNPPTINGPTNGNAGTEYSYTFVSTDPNGDGIANYSIDWDDNNVEVIEGPFASGEEVTVSHTWDEKGTYTIRAKATDVFGAESDWGTLTVTMPKNQQSSQSQQSQSFPLLQKLFKATTNR